MSGKADTIYVRNPEGFYKEEEVDPSLVFVEEQRGPDYWALVPVVKQPKLCGPMDGGNLASSSDSRIKHVYHIHDRFETWEMYERMSR